MDPTIPFLLSIGLCLDPMIRAQRATLPRPTLWAVPSPVVPNGEDVTLRCQGHLGSDRFQLWKDGELREERNASWQLAEFVLRQVDGVRDARSYRCRSGQGPWWSELSEPLALVVTGNFPEPKIGASSISKIPPGTTVTIRCQMLQRASTQDYSFVLLEAKSLEPLQLQNPAGKPAVFSILSVRAEDTGSYSCIYYRKMAPHWGSHPSQALELTVSGRLPRPILWVHPLSVVATGANLTFWCSRPKVFSLEEVTFILWKAGTQEPLQKQSSAEPWTSFLLPSVKPEDTGSYSCAYREGRASGRESEPSDALKLLVTGSLPKPSLSALPGRVVEPGMHVTLQCRQAPQTFLSGVTFILVKVGAPQPLQSQSPAGTSADFLLLSVRAQDAGHYSCAYYNRMAPSQVSEPSEVLEIWVTDVVPKPLLSAWPGPEVASGANVTLLCWGPSWGSRFVLSKEGDEKILQSMDTTQDGPRFFLTHVTLEHSGNYTCGYQIGNNGSLWTQHSDPLQLIVRGTLSINTLIITLSCVSFIFLLCLILTSFHCQRSISMDSLEGESPRRFLCCSCLSWNTHLPHQSMVHREETLYTEVAKERQREPLVPIAEDPQGVAYTQLNLRTLNKKKTDPKKTHTKSMPYDTVSLN